MLYPTPQTPDEMEREVLASIRRAAWDMIRAIDRGDVNGAEIHYNFIVTQWKRRKTIVTTIQQKPRQF